MLARYTFLAIIAIGAVLAALRLVPGDLERLAMLERDGRHEQALGELDTLYASGQRDPQLMLRLYDLKVRFGLVEEARAVLEEYARLRPHDLEAQIGLIRFYQTNQLETEYVRTLRDVQDRTRSRVLLNELVGFFRMTGRFREEEELLDRTAKANRAGPAEFERLGLLAAARGDLQRAAVALRRADGRLDAPSRAARLGLFRVLLELRETDEAHQRCVAWLRNWRDPELAVELMDALGKAGRVDLALDLGNRFGEPGSDVTLATAELLHEQGRPADALQRLREYQSAGLPEDAERAQRFVMIAATAGDAEMALQAARLVGFRKLEAGVILDLLDAIQDAMEGASRNFPVEAVRGLSAEIEARMQNVAPVALEATDKLVLADDARLFVTQLAIIDNDRELARKHLASVDPDRLNPFDLSRWTDLQVAAGLRTTVYPNLPRDWRRRDRPSTLVRRVQQIERAQTSGDLQGATGRPRTPESTSAQPTAPAVPPAQSAGGWPVREAQGQQVSQLESGSARARRQRRRVAAIERQRERARLRAQRREQQGSVGAVPKTVVPVPLPALQFPSTVSGG